MKVVNTFRITLVLQDSVQSGLGHGIGKNFKVLKCAFMKEPNLELRNFKVTQIKS